MITPTHSLQHLSRFLELDRKKVFIGEGSISPQLIEKVEKSRIMVGLCEECACLNKSFSELYKQLEKAEMEVLSHLKKLHKKFSGAGEIRNNRKLRGFLDIGNDSDEALTGKLEIADALRNETIQMGSRKLFATQPKVKVQKLKEKDVLRKKIKLEKKCVSSIMENNYPACKSENTPESFLNIEPDNVKWEHSNPNMDELSNDRGHSDLDNLEDYVQPDLSTGLELDSDNEQSSQEVTHTVSVNYQNEGVTAQNSDPSSSGKRKCRLCQKEFIARTFAKHFRNVHLKIRYKCKLCEKIFTQKDNLKTHQQRVHLG